MERDVYHIGYLTIHRETGDYYIGVHSTDDPDDGYLGSGIDLMAAVSVYGRKAFTRHVLAEFDTRQEAMAWERAMVTDHQVQDPHCYNRREGGAVTRPVRRPRPVVIGGGGFDSPRTFPRAVTCARSFDASVQTVLNWLRRGYASTRFGGMGVSYGKRPPRTREPLVKAPDIPPLPA